MGSFGYRLVLYANNCAFCCFYVRFQWIEVQRNYFHSVLFTIYFDQPLLLFSRLEIYQDANWLNYE